MPSNARNLANLLGAGESTISVEKLGSDVPPGTEDYSSVDSLGVGTTIGETAFVEGSNRLYIWNGSGWYNIALINTTPTWDSGGQPAVSYELDADSPQTATTITLAASDPEGIPISYNYITSGQMDSIATISQDSSVFTITPKTIAQAPDGGTGSITFRATDGINILPQVSSFTLNFISIIENSRYTTLLATATGTSDNNNITDASTNNHTITVNGDAHAGTFSPYRSGGYSVYLPAINGGSEHNISFDHDAGFNFGSGDFTIEFSVYFPSNSTATDYLFQHGESTGSWNVNTYNGVVNLFLNGLSIGNDVLADSSNTISNNLNKWIYYAIVRSGTTVTMYRNGTSIATKTSAQNANVGATLDTTNAEYLHINRRRAGIGDGTEFYFKDFRVTKGLARTITAITEPLTSDVNTSILVGNLPYIGDASSNSHTATYIGSPSIKPISPYDYEEYNAADHGGSVYFDGTGDYLTIPDHSSLNFASNDWTIECWVYPRTNVGDCGIWHQSASGGTDWFSIYLDGSFNPKFVLKNNNAEEWAGTAAANTAPQNAWTHIALVRRFGTDIKLYANGKVVHTETQHLNVALEDKSYNHIIGYQRFAGDGNAFDGLISDFKIDVGTAHYTAEFTPPTAPVSSTGSDMHIKGTDASIIDKSQGSNLKLVGSTTGSTTQVKFANTKSMYFDGNSDYITIPNNELYGFGTDDWTIETWLYCTKTGGFNAIFDTRVGSGTQSGNFGIGMYNTGRVQLFSGGIFYYPTDTLSFNTWQHFAVVKNSGTTTMYFNGTAASSTYSDSRNYGSSQPVQIGKDDTVSNYFGGYMQDFRITKDLARYTANFTPPTTSLEG